MYNIFISNKCIGCGMCLDTCPIQAINGICNTVFKIIESECIGCKLCIDICPIACIFSNKTFLNFKINKFVIKSKIFDKNHIYSYELYFISNNTVSTKNTLFKYKKNLF